MAKRRLITPRPIRELAAATRREIKLQQPRIIMISPVKQYAGEQSGAARRTAANLKQQRRNVMLTAQAQRWPKAVPLPAIKPTLTLLGSPKPIDTARFKRNINLLQTAATKAKRRENAAKARAARQQLNTPQPTSVMAPAGVSALMQPVKVAPVDRARAALAIKRTMRQAQMTQRRTRVATARAVNRLQDQWSQVKSSNVEAVFFDPDTLQLYIKFHSGSTYKYDLTDYGGKKTADKIFWGQASCITEGQNQYGRWWVDKNPSVGAAVWKYLRRAGVPYQLIYY